MRVFTSATSRFIATAAVLAAVAVGTATGGAASAQPAPQPVSAQPTPRAVAAAGDGTEGHRVPRLAAAWAAGWTSTDPYDLARLFTADATYTDLAVDKTSHGRSGVAAWQAGTHKLIAGADITIRDAFRSGNRVLIDGFYTGHIHGAPHPFGLRMATVLHLRGNRIVSDADYYNLADLLRQSGLPPTWTPGT